MCFLSQHVIVAAEIGTRRMQKKSATYSDIFKEISKQVRS